MPSDDAPSIQAALGKQRHGNRIALTLKEVDQFLRETRTCRVATVSNGRPHVSPLWFAWHAGSLWLYSIAASQRFRDLVRDPAVAIVIDDGRTFNELRGVEISGEAVVVGEVPRVGTENVDELVELEQLYARKYQGRDQLRYDGRHAWIKVTPAKLVSWDYRKMPERR